MASARKKPLPRKSAEGKASATAAAPATPRKRRPVVPAAQAQELLVETTIRLLRTRAFDRVTARLITAEAGLDLSTIPRNFGSMQNLFVIVCRQLGAQAFERRQEAVGSIDRSNAGELLFDPDLVLRSRLIAWMVAEGVDGAVEEERQKATMTLLSNEFRSQLPVSERTAWIWMHLMLFLSEGYAVFGESHYLSQTDVIDAFQLVLALREQLPTIERTINWAG